MIKKVKKNLDIILFSICLLCVITCTIYISKWIIDNKANNKTINTINENTTIIEINNNENTIKTQDESLINKDDPYWKYIDTKLIDVNIDQLKKLNSDTVLWLAIDNTNINYPVVQTDNNDYYLKNSIEKKKNSAGWLFMDYRNNPNEFDRNTIIYGHSRKNNTMFGTLQNLLKKNDKTNIIKISTDKENTLWQIFSAYTIPETSDYLKMTFESDENFLEFGTMLLNRSQKNYNTTINENDKIITLSTCYKTNERVVVHAKLIKKEEKELKK